MDLGSLFLIVALLVLTVWFVGRPFLERSAPAGKGNAPLDQTHSALLAERDRILNALRDLDFDYTLGKIPAEDYPAQRQRLRLRGAEVLRALDAFSPTDGPAAPAEPMASPAPARAEVEDRLEAAIAARRADAAALPGMQRKPVVGTAAVDDDLEVALAARRRQRREKAAGFCPRCGAALQKSDKFCPKCGARNA